MKRFRRYEADSDYIYDKDLSNDTFKRYMLAISTSMFDYKGLPETIPARELELILQTNGYGFITEHNEKLYVFDGNLGGDLDEYKRPTTIIVTNPYLNLSKTFTIKDDIDGVLCRNDNMLSSNMPFMSKYASLFTENIITMNSVNIQMRMVKTISASDEKTKASADEYINKVENGKNAVVGENAFFDGIKVSNNNINTGYMQQLIEYQQYLKSSFLSYIGIKAPWNMKREYIGKHEYSLSDDCIRPIVDNMFHNRQDFCKRVNAKYNTNISVDFAGIWKTKQLADLDEKANYTTDIKTPETKQEGEQ